jgi:predicted flavoprotein YhiN
MKVAIIGGGAAGCFCAVELKRRCPSCDVVVLEAGKRPLAKVAVTGGGRCNLTNSFAGITSLTQAYPRGERLMKRALKVFGSKETMEWFEREGVPLVTQEDCCVFPRSQDAMQIVRKLLRQIGEPRFAVCHVGIETVRGVRHDHRNAAGYGMALNAAQALPVRAAAGIAVEHPYRFQRRAIHFRELRQRHKDAASLLQ